MRRNTVARLVSIEGSRRVHRLGRRARRGDTWRCSGAVVQASVSVAGRATGARADASPPPAGGVVTAAARSESPGATVADVSDPMEFGTTAVVGLGSRCDGNHDCLYRTARRLARVHRYTRSRPKRRVETDCREETTVETIVSARLFYIFQWAAQSKVIPGALIFETQGATYRSIDNGPFDLAYVDPDQFALERAEAGLAAAPLVA